MSSLRRLVLPADGLAAIRAHVAWEMPNEACGLLAFDQDRVRMVYPLTNTDASPISFTIAPEEHFGALVHAERHGWEIAGSFHSHPGSVARPSPTDVGRSFDPGWVHLIVGGDGEVGAFRINGRRIIRLAIAQVE